MRAAGAVAPEEAFEDVGQVCLRDADAGVGDLDPHLRGRGGEAHEDLPARLGVADRVLEEVVEDLPHAVGVDEGAHGLLGKLHGQLELLV